MDSTTESPWPSPRIVYSRHYNISVLGFERLHPFDSRKYGRAWKQLRRAFGLAIRKHLVCPSRPIRREELLNLHTAAYLDRLKDKRFVASVLEVPQLEWLPAWVIDRLVLRPMRWATMGTILAANEAMKHGLAINLSGGYHHASPDFGHGFSAYADVGLAVDGLRRSGTLGEKDKVVYVDLDAHQGNGVCRTFFDDSRVFIYDQYNLKIFPVDIKAQRRIDCDVRVATGCTDLEYLSVLKDKLPSFLNSVTRHDDARLAIYNARTDIYTDDQLGRLNVSADAILERDQFVLNELVARKLPTMIVLSGGYSRESFKHVARMAQYVLERWGQIRPV